MQNRGDLARFHLAISLDGESGRCRVVHLHPQLERILDAFPKRLCDQSALLHWQAKRLRDDLFEPHASSVPPSE